MSPLPEVAANTRKLISYSNKSGAASEEWLVTNALKEQSFYLSFISKNNNSKQLSSQSYM
jgi:hypothetical protein